MRTRSLLAAPAAAALLLGCLGGVAVAQEQPSAECSAVQQQLAALQADLDGAIAADNAAGATTDSQLVTTLKSQVQVTLGLVEQQCTPAAPEPTTEPDPTTEPPAPTTEPPADDDPPYETCAEAIADGAIMPAVRGINDSYQADLDSDGDGVACEANEGTGGGDTGGDSTTGGSDTGGDVLGGSDTDTDSGVVDSIPQGSIDTGYVAAP